MKDLDDAVFEEPKERRHVSRAVRLAVAAQELREGTVSALMHRLEKECSAYTIPASTIGTLASEVSVRFGFLGPSHIISTGCASSTEALGNAVHTIQWHISPRVLEGRQG